MQERKKSRQERREEMLAHVAAYRHGDMTRAQYCACHDINLHTMAYWCAKADKIEPEGGFTTLSPVSDTTIDLHYPNGVKLSLPMGTPLSEVAACIHLY